jgi:branched-chain amino acid transport system substrate-binding protein
MARTERSRTSASPQRCVNAKIPAKDNPGGLREVTFDKNGNLDRESFLVKVENGKQGVTATLPLVAGK